MTNEIIKPHNFEIAKNQIHALSQKVPPVSLKKFKTEGNIIPWNDHNVTGEEINNFLVSPLQDTLRFQNTNIRNLFKITNEVYKALESLDKEYIQAIIAAVKSAEIASGQAKTASNQAKDASREALEASRKANNAQEDIKKTIEALQATVKILKDFKEKVSKEIPYFSTINSKLSTFQAKILAIEHDNKLVSESAKLITELKTSVLCQVHIKDIDTLWRNLQENKLAIDSLGPNIEKIGQIEDDISRLVYPLIKQLKSFSHTQDIDTIWNDVENNKDNLVGIHSQLDAFIEKVNQVTEYVNSDIASLQQYRSLLESYEHLGDVDAIWNDVENHKDILDSLHFQIDAFVENVKLTTEHINSGISTLQQYRSLLESYEHLGDVDNIWKDVESHKDNLDGLHSQLDAFVEKVSQVTENINSNIAALQHYRSLLESYEHLGNVDTIWNDVEDHKGDLTGLHSQIDAFVEMVDLAAKHINSDISALQQYRSLLESYKHLGDVDNIWKDVESHKDNLDGLHSQIDAFVKKVSQVTENINSDIAALQHYRSLLESHEHLGDIDTIWNDVEDHKGNLTGLHSQIDAFVEMVDLAAKHINSDIKALQQHRSILETYKHLGDIDTIWNDVENHKDNLASLHSQIDAFVKKVKQETENINSDIAALQQYRSLLESYEHLGDIDTIWSDVEGHKNYLNNIDTKLTDFITETHSVTTSIKEGINTIEKKHLERNIIVDKKIKIAYGIAGGAIAFSVVQLILLLLGIL